jgi:glycosyltransferase involved in cell wall biosynthesis
VLTADYPPRPWSGIGVAVERQARALAARGVEVTVLVAEPAREEGRGETPRGLTVLSLGRGRFPVDPRRFDRVHVHSLRLAGLAQQLARRFGLPLAATVHGQPRFELEASPFARAWSEVQRRLLLAADRVVFLSRAEREAALAWIPALGGRSLVIPNGLAVVPRAGAAAEGPALPVVFAGRFAASKGINLLAGLVPALLTELPNPVVLAGGHGDPVGEGLARELAARFPDRVRLAGWLDGGDLARLLAASALVLVPSFYEPFGLVALEAQAAGAPVLAADVGGLREVVGHGSGGLRLASRDPRRWAETARALLTSGAASALGALGPGWVARRFSIESVAARLAAEVYAGPLGKRRASSVPLGLGHEGGATGRSPRGIGTALRVRLAHRAAPDRPEAQ